MITSNSSASGLVDQTYELVELFAKQLSVPTEREAHLLFAYGSLQRCIEAFEAVRLLLQNNSVVFAMAICRSLVEDTFRLEEFSESDVGRRKQLVVWFELRSIAQINRWLHASKDYRDTDLQVELDKLSRRRDAILAYAQRNKVTQAKFREPDQHARRNGGGDLSNFLVFQEALHGSDMARMLRREVTNDIASYGKPIAGQFAEVTGLAACDYMVRSIEAFSSSMPGVVLPPEHGELRSALEARASEL